MPAINLYKCTNCDLSLPSGWGGYTYVKDDNDNKVVCPHPGESVTIAKVLGLNRNDISGFPWIPQVYDDKVLDLLIERTGFNSHCICLNCLNQFDLDVDTDERICSNCNSDQVKTELEQVGQQCPKCKTGKVEMFETGIIS